MPKNRLSTGAHQIWWAPGYRLNLEKKTLPKFSPQRGQEEIKPLTLFWNTWAPVEGWIGSLYFLLICIVCITSLPSPSLPSGSVSTHCFLPINWMKAYALVCSCDGVSKREFVPLDQVFPLLVLNCFLLLRENKTSSLLWAPGRFTLFSTIRIVLDCF